MAREEPAGAPICWSKQFDDDDDECKNCNYNVSCRPATINNNSARRNGQSPQLQMPQYHLPMMPQQPPSFATRYGYNSAQQMPGPMLPQASGYPRTPPPPPQMAHAQVQTGFQPHAPSGWNTPIAYLPRPNPSNPAWWQYQGESTRARLGKNMLLGALQALFAELLRFLANWTWPAVPVTT